MTEENLNYSFKTKEAEKLLKQKKYKNAVSAYLHSLIKDRNNPAIRIGLSKSYKGLGDYNKAIEHLNAAKKEVEGLKKYEFEISYELGINHLLNAEPFIAVEHFRRAIKLNPKNINAQIQLAIAHELLDEPDMALMIYEKILEEKPEFILCHSHKAGLYMNLGDFEEAAKVFKRILKINPDYFRANLGLGICLDKMERKHFAIRYYKKYIVKRPYSDTTKALVGRIVEIYSSKTPGRQRRLRVVS